MGVIDKGMGQEGMQQGLHRGVRGCRIDQVLALGGHHRLITESIKDPQGAQRFKAHRRMPRGLNGAQIPATAFDTEHGDRFTEQAHHGGLNGSIATAMEHQLGIRPQQTGAVGAQGQIGTHSLGPIAGDRLLGVAIRPAVLDGHGGEAAGARG